ncbi:FERM domain-containing protein 4A [Sarcoptes scabiei]|uniref:FERM domain-containing protein 4A n=1 Tax=Sarcoptes scabiei TaxID=52283 RepID=A0A834VHL5_SARSC|nr:FERM domain-containing protein 4A [Sarcoptes scabiei]
MSTKNNDIDLHLGEVILLDGRSVEFIIQPRLFAGDLFDTVASHFDLKEKEYFGLAFLDSSGQYNWLNLERRLLEHEYARNEFNHLSSATFSMGENLFEIKPQSIDERSRTGTTGDCIDGPIKNRDRSMRGFKPSLNHHRVKTNENEHCRRSDTISNNKSTNFSNNHHHHLPSINKIRNLKRKNKEFGNKFSTTTMTSSSSMVVNHLKKPLARLMMKQSIGQLERRKLENRKPNQLLNGDADEEEEEEEDAPPLPDGPPPVLPLILDTPERINLMIDPSDHFDQHRKRQNGDEDPLYDVIDDDDADDDGREENGIDDDGCDLDGNGNDVFETLKTIDCDQINSKLNDFNQFELPNNLSPFDSSRNADAVSFSQSKQIVQNNIDIDNISIESQQQQQQQQQYQHHHHSHHLSQQNHQIEPNSFEDRRYHHIQQRSSSNRLVLHFLVKYFVESITMLQETNTIELFYLQAKSLLLNEIVQVDLETSLKLSALILQATYGDSKSFSESKTRARIHRLQLISSFLLKELLTYQNCENRILEQYRQLTGLSYGESIFQFMILIEQQPTYGVHFYEVKDKSNIPYWLGLSFKGIDQFSFEERKKPLKQFSWRQLENLYFRERKFSIEVRDLKRVIHTLSSINLYENAIQNTDTIDDLSSAICDPTTQVSVSRRTFGPSNVTVYVWFAATPSLTKYIWSMAISQHQFYIDHRLNKSSKHLQRSREEIVESLNRRNTYSTLLYNQYYSNNYRTSYIESQEENINADGGDGSQLHHSHHYEMRRDNQRNSILSNSSSSIENCSNSSSIESSTNHSTSKFGLGHLSNQIRSIQFDTNRKDTLADQTIPQATKTTMKSSSLISLNLNDSNGQRAEEERSKFNQDINHHRHHLHRQQQQVLRSNSQLILAPRQQQQQQTQQINRNQPFRHSTTTTNLMKMFSKIGNNGTSNEMEFDCSKILNKRIIKYNKLNRLRQLESMLQIKLDELNHLNQIEYELLMKASQSNRRLSTLTNDDSSTITMASIHSIESSSTSSSSSSSSLSASMIAANQTGKNSIRKQNQIERYQINSDSKAKTFGQTNSLKNFVVTGRASSSLSQQTIDGNPSNSNLKVREMNLRSANQNKIDPMNSINSTSTSLLSSKRYYRMIMMLNEENRIDLINIIEANRLELRPEKTLNNNSIKINRFRENLRLPR